MSSRSMLLKSTSLVLTPFAGNGIACTHLAVPALLKSTTSRVGTGKLVQQLQIGKNLWHTLRGARLIWAPTSGRPAISLLTLPLAAARHDRSQH